MPQDPLARMGLARSPVMKLLKPSQQEMDSPNMTEGMRNFFLGQQNIEGNLAEMQRQAAASQTGLQAETAAQQYYQQPPSARERFLADNPQTWSSSAGPGIYRKQMMQQRQTSLADRTLAPTIASKLPVTARGEFMSLIEAGTPVLEAKQAVEMKEYNRGLRAKMAEVMTPEEIAQKFGSDDTPLDEVRVMSEIAQRKRAGKGETDLQREYLLDALSTYERGAADKLLLADDPEYQSLVGRLKELDKKRLEKFAPSGTVPSPPAQMSSEQARESLLKKLNILKQ